MAYVTPTTVLTNDLIAAGDWNKNTVANPIALRTGEIALASQAIGDLVIATSATQLGRVADVATGQVLVSGGVATAPAYSDSPSITALTYSTNLKSTTALATPSALSATQATAFASTVSGASIMGFGTTNDVALMNRAGTVVLGVGPNTTAVNIAGVLTTPAQPAFLATAATQSNVTGDGTDYTITFTTEIFDQASNFSTSTFTAPVTGRYQLNTMIGLTGLSSAHINLYVQIITSNRTYTNQFQRGSEIASDTYGIGLSVLADMDAADTATVHIVVTGGTKIVDIVLGGQSTFSGYLAC